MVTSNAGSVPTPIMNLLRRRSERSTKFLPEEFECRLLGSVLNLSGGHDIDERVFDRANEAMISRD